MTDMLANGHIGSRRGFGRKRKYEGYNTAHPPTEAEQDAQTPEQRDRAPLYTPQQIEEETKTVRLIVSFTDPIKIRDQMEMLIEAAQIIIRMTRTHDIGSVRQRVEARREAASLSRALTRFNGKTPYGDSRRKPRQY